MPRGQWMATEGRQIYHEWLAELIEKRRTEDLDYNLIDFLVESSPKTKLKNHRSLVTHNLESFARYMYNDILRNEQYESSDVRENSRLVASTDKIMEFTSADEWLRGGGESLRPRAIGFHANDGVSFATFVAMGLAYEAYNATYNSIHNAQYLYDGLASILQDKSFHRALEEFSTTGFAVYRDETTLAVMNNRTSETLAGIIGYNPSHKIMVTTINEQGEYEYNLNPVAAEQLRKLMNEQNKTHLINGGTYHGTIKRHLAERSFTSGCPVRKAPNPEAKSAIALMSDYMGERLTEVSRAWFNKGRLGSTAIEAVLQS